MLISDRLPIVAATAFVLASSLVAADDGARKAGTQPTDVPAVLTYETLPPHEFFASTEQVPVVGAQEQSPDMLLSPIATPEYSILKTSMIFQDDGPAPVQPAAPAFQSRQNQSAASAGLSSSVFGQGANNASLLAETRRARAFSPNTSVVFGQESRIRATTDAGNLLGKSNATIGVNATPRSPIITGTSAQGSTVGQMLASGSYWFPARQDLDTILSKIDSRNIEDIVVIKGPYTSTLGPGFQFIDVELKHAPRYANGPEAHGSSGFEYKSNGDQWYGRQALWGGDYNWGYHMSYGHRVGNDYKTGNGQQVPSGYNSRDFHFVLGGDIDRDSRVEFQYLRLDQTDVEVPVQALDLEYLKTDGFEFTYVLENQESFDRLTMETWYNSTELEADTMNAGKRALLPLLTAQNIAVTTHTENSSAGFSGALEWEGPENSLTTAGADFRYLQQEIDQIQTADFFPAATMGANAPLPKAYQANPGLFVEHTTSPLYTTRFKVGGRIDLVDSNARSFTGDTNLGQSNLATFIPSDNLEDVLGGSFNQSFTLGSAFATVEHDVDDIYTLTGGMGFAMRAPTMTELYAVSPLTSQLPQTAIMVVFGDPNLRSEKRYQMDLGMKADYGPLKVGVNSYGALTQDFITLDSATGPLGLLMGYVNTPLASVVGIDGYANYSMYPRLDAFATLSWTAARDLTRNRNAYPFAGNATGNRSQVPGKAEPMYGILPLESRMGFIFHEASPNPRWSVETSARVVAAQTRIAASLREQKTPTFTTVDIRGALRATDNLSFIAGVENLFDSNYQEHTDPHSVAFFTLGQTGSVFRPGVNLYVGSEFVY